MSIISKELLKLNLKAGLLIKIKFNKDTEKSYKVNGRVLLKILKLNCKSEIGIKYNFKDIKCIKDFKENFPITNYDFYEDYMDFCYTVLVDDVARTEFDWKIYHLVEEDIDEMFNQYKTHIG